MELGMGLSPTILRPSGAKSYLNPDHAKLLLHFDSDFMDSASYGDSAILLGAPTIDTGQKVFGAGSMANGDGQGVKFPKSTDWYIWDSIPWQLSFRWYSSSARVNDLEMLFANTDTDPGFRIRALHHINQIDLISASVAFNWPFTTQADKWVAYRMNHDGLGNYRLYVDGVLVGVRQDSGNQIDITAPLVIGNRPLGDQEVVGNFDEILWEKHADLVVTTDPTYTVETKAFEFDPTPIAPPVNPFSMTQLQLHLNSDFSDSSTNNHSPTLLGTPNINTTNKVFGAGSMRNDIGEAIRYPASTAWILTDSTPWQLSFRWRRDNAATGNVHLFSNRNPSIFGANGYSIRMVDFLGRPRIDILDSSGANVEWEYTPVGDVWTAYRLNYDGSNLLRLYADGVLIGARTAPSINTSSQALHVGNVISLDRSLIGYLDEIKWEKHANLQITNSPVYKLETGAFPDS